MISVFQDWLFNLPMQQQSVLVLACRGPDGIGKFHPTKEIVKRYRASVLKAAYYGRPMQVDEYLDNSFMSLQHFSRDKHWEIMCHQFFQHADELAHHYYMHLMHGAQVIGYKHPDGLFRRRWEGFYLACCLDLHLGRETEQQMDLRLNDWAHEHWQAAGATVQTDALQDAQNRIAALTEALKPFADFADPTGSMPADWPISQCTKVLGRKAPTIGDCYKAKSLLDPTFKGYRG